jgi:uncharacterized membrane protein
VISLIQINWPDRGAKMDQDGMAEHAPKTTRPACVVGGEEPHQGPVYTVGDLRPGLAARILRDTPNSTPASLICEAHLAGFRRLYLEDLLEREHGELSDLDREVLASLDSGQTVVADVENAYDAGEGRDLGARAADAVARFGGSWTFILIFLGFLVLWMVINVVALFGRDFDPYPFILLNLMLSCVAAIQAPIIMMSQRRAEAKDRLRAENDYKVNLKAELEIRRLHDKIDHHLARQWHRLADLEKAQADLAEQAVARSEERTPPAEG